MDTARLRRELEERAKALGFDELRITEAALPERVRREYRQFVEADLAGEMGWLVREPERREDPRGLWPEARTAICLAMNYGPGGDPLDGLRDGERGYISVYARGRDYHEVMKGRMKQLAGWLHARSGAAVKVFVDTAPVLEKPLAQRAGLGWQGRHTNLVSRRFGSWLFLGEILTDLVLPPDPPEADRCGSCRRCIAACPTGAITGPYRLDPRRCISYLTIEHKGAIPAELRPMMGNRIYGCDDCLAVCPWNKFARRCREAKLEARPELEAPDLAMLATLEDAGFRRLFKGSPIKRIGRDRVLRNVLIAIGNSGDTRFLPVVRRRLADASPLVRGAAVWALSRLVDRPTVEKMSGESTETHPQVRAEWREALRRCATAA